MLMLLLPEVAALGRRHASRLGLRDALLLVASVATSYLPASREPDKLSWMAQGWLAGRAIGQRRGLRAALSIQDLTLLLLEHETPIASLPLMDKTLDEATRWLEATLVQTLPKGYTRNLRRSETSLAAATPPRFEVSPELLSELKTWFGRSHTLLVELARQPGCSAVSYNPAGADLSFKQHVSDLSLEIGFSTGDKIYSSPYFFVTPWPVPEAAAAIGAALPLGHWHSQGWKGAVLTLASLNAVSEHSGEQISQLKSFFMKVRQDLYEAAIGKWRLSG